MKNLEGKVAIVTGAARGIGQQIAKVLAERGAKIAVVDLKAEWCAETVGLVEAAGSEALALGVNVAVSAEVDQCVKDVLAKFGKIDIMINNAGITKDGLLMRMSDEDWDAVLNVNLKGTFLFTRAVARPMMKNKAADGTQLGGSIVNLASVAGVYGSGCGLPYPTSKAGVIGMTKSLAWELAALQVRVNAVAPGVVATDMVAALPQFAKDSINNTIPLKRFAEPEDIANAILFLASSAASYITGVILQVDGGYRPANVLM